MIYFSPLFIGILLLAFLLKNTNKSLNYIQCSLVVIALTFSTLGLLNFVFNSVERGNALLGDRVFDTEILVGILSFSLLYMVLFKDKKLYFSYLLLLTNAISLVYLFVLRTRAGWAAIGIILIIMICVLLRYYRNFVNTKKVVSRLGLVIVLAIAVTAIIPVSKNYDRADFIKTAVSIFDINYYSNQNRFNFWNASLKMFAEKPYSGIGSGKWAGTYPIHNGESYTDENIDMNSAINPHNDYLEILSEYGIFGFLLFTGFVFTGLYLLYKKARKEIIYLPFLLSALGLCVTMFFSFTKDNLWAMMIFFLCMGVGYSGNYKFRIQNSEFYNKYKKIFRIILLVVCLLMLSTGIYFKVMSYLNEKEYISAMKLKAQGKYVEMLERLEGVSNFYYPVDMNKMPIDYYRGAGYFELKQYDKALDKFRIARKYMGYYPAIMNNEASALYMTGKYKEEEERYLEVKRIFPNYIEPQINLLSLYTNQKLNKEAKNLLSELDIKIINPKYVKNYSVFLGIKNYFNGTMH